MAARPVRPYEPDAQECAILLLLLVNPTGLGKERTRVRLAEITLKRLWGRRRLRDDFLREVEDWLFRAGWALFYSGTTFALVRTKSVEGWPRESSKRLAAELKQVVQGEFDFSPYYHLLLGDEDGTEASE